MKTTARVAAIAAAALIVLLASCERSPTAPAKAISAAPQTRVVAQSAVAANQLEAQVENVYSQVSPSVVNITTRTMGYNFFSMPVPEQGTGSGFILDGKGDVVTNYHVVQNATSITVTLPDRRSFKAKIIGQDPTTDIAVVRIPDQGLPPPLQFGDSTVLRVGQFVIAVGNPFGLNRTMTFGVISALGRIIQSPDGRFIGEAIQTDAPINPGNSGGPLLDLEGHVIGITSQILSPSGSSAGIGFAVPSQTVRRVAEELVKSGHFAHTWLGIQGIDLTPDTVRALKDGAGINLPVDSGMLIAQVVPGSPAAKAGMRGGDRLVMFGNAQVPVGGDIITAIDGTPIGGFQDLTVYLDSHTTVGQTVTVTIFRGEQKRDLKATLTERPAKL